MSIGRLIASAAVLCALNSPAMATATLNCSVDDENIEFDFQGHVGSLADAATPSIIKLKLKRHAPEAVFDFPAEDNTPELTLGQQWVSKTDIRLRIYTQSGVDFVIKATNQTPDDGFDYFGTYEISLTLSGAQMKYKGRSTCNYG